MKKIKITIFLLMSWFSVWSQTHSGNVGIGTASPESIGGGYITVDARGSNGAGYRFGSVNDIVDGATFANLNDLSVHFGSTTNHPIKFFTNNTTRAQISADGHFAILGAALQTSTSSYKNLYLGNASIMSRIASHSANSYWGANVFYSGSAWEAINTTGEGVGVMGHSGGNITWSTYNGSVVDGNTYSLTDRFKITKAGNVGIGTTSPSYKLTVKSEDENQLRFENGSENAFFRLQDDGHLNLWVHGDDDMIFTRGTGSGTESMRINSTGNVGIGTNDPQSKLAVEGQIRATEVKVLADISVPDYVFESDYQLRTLKETKEYIAENKHLPEIPSAAEIGENGIDLGDMNMRLLKKIEELTLYQIQLLETVENLQVKVEKLENEN